MAERVYYSAREFQTASVESARGISINLSATEASAAFQHERAFRATRRYNDDLRGMYYASYLRGVRVLLACKGRPYFTSHRCCWQMKEPKSYHLLSRVYILEALFRAKPGDSSFGERAQVDLASLLCLGAKC